jgi:hypothetical protein
MLRQGIRPLKVEAGAARLKPRPDENAAFARLPAARQSSLVAKCRSLTSFGMTRFCFRTKASIAALGMAPPKQAHYQMV